MQTKKTDAVALANLENFELSMPVVQNAPISKQEMEKCLMGDIPKEFWTKQTLKTSKKEDMTR